MKTTDGLGRRLTPAQQKYRNYPQQHDRALNGMEGMVVTPKPAPPKSSWWMCDPATFYERAKSQSARMQLKPINLYPPDCGSFRDSRTVKTIQAAWDGESFVPVMDEPEEAA